MGITINKIEPHWNYLISLEYEIETLSRYVEFVEDNFKCYSIEITRLLMSAAAEVDVVCKQICKNANTNSKASSIGGYKPEILASYPNIVNFKVIIPRYGLELVPWDNWKKEGDSPPFWWTANNKVKHFRHTHYKKGNLKNALNAVAGLFIMILYLYKDKAEAGKLFPELKMLDVSQDNINHRRFGKDGISCMYKL